jgi:hypothetical protein
MLTPVTVNEHDGVWFETLGLPYGLGEFDRHVNRPSMTAIIGHLVAQCYSPPDGPFGQCGRVARCNHGANELIKE